MRKQIHPFDGGKNENLWRHNAYNDTFRYVSTDYTHHRNCFRTLIRMRYIVGLALLVVILYTTGEFLSCYFMLSGSPDWCERFL